MQSKTLSIRCPGEVREPLERATAQQTRTVTHQILHYVREGLRRDGYLPHPSEDDGAERQVAAK